MNKHMLIGGIAILAVGGAYITFSKQSSEPSASPDATEEEQMQEESLSVERLRDILQKKGSYTCDYRDDTGSKSQEGTVYIDGERVRGNMTMQFEGDEPFDAHFIKNAEWIYSWGGPFTMNGAGTKLAVVQEDDADSVDESMDDIFDLDQEIDFSCKTWKVDEAMFAPPADVEFKEFSLENAMADVKKDLNLDIDCSLCDQAPGDQAQAQCREALGC